MSKNKAKKQITLYEQYKGTIIWKGLQEEIKRVQRRYQKHRNKSKGDSK